jgi:hypothetical protein
MPRAEKAPSTSCWIARVASLRAGRRRGAAPRLSAWHPTAGGRAWHGLQHEPLNRQRGAAAVLHALAGLQQRGGALGEAGQVAWGALARPSAAPHLTSVPLGLAAHASCASL